MEQMEQTSMLTPRCSKRIIECLAVRLHQTCAASSGSNFMWELWLLCFLLMLIFTDAAPFHFLFWLHCFFVDMYGMSPSSWVGTSWATSLTSKPYQTTCCFRLRPSFFSNFHGAQQTLCSKTLWWPHAEHDGGAGHEVLERAKVFLLVTAKLLNLEGSFLETS